MTAEAEPLSADEQRLAELGYKQELKRGWSGFSNFAISFSIISILAGCFTTYGQAWLNGGPVAISIGWPVISVFILLVAFSMAELASAMPTAGGIYYWSSKLGGPAWGWFTGWFNLVGLVAVTASVDYAAATFLNSTLSFYGLHLFGVNFATASVQSSLHHVFVLFAIILIAHALINIFSSHLVALFTQVSVWWHVIGVLVIIVLLVAVPSHHQSFAFVFGHRQNFSGFSNNMYWFYVLPLGFLLTMYTITGYDASAHISEETHDAADGGAQGRVAVRVLLGRVRLVRAAGVDLRRHAHQGDRRGGRDLAVDHRIRADVVGGQGGARHLHRRPAVLRHGLCHQRQPDDVRVLA